MFRAAALALHDITSPAQRGVLLKSIGLAILLFIAVGVAAEVGVSYLSAVPWQWLKTLVQLAAGLGLFAAFFFLMAPVTALFAGLFQDQIAARLEAEHYPAALGRPLGWWPALLMALKFTGLALAINLVVLPLVLFAGFGLVLMLAANAYLIGREYFELTAARYMPVTDAAALRRANALRVFVAGLIPGALALVPFVNFVTPVFATSYFLHLFRGLAFAGDRGRDR